MIIIDDPLMTHDQVAEYLDIPSLAVSQLVFDDKITFGPELSFKKEEIEELKKNESTYLDSLR